MLRSMRAMPARAYAIVTAALVASVFAVVLGVVRPETLVHDWHGWRQADTATIALNYAHGDLDVLHPQIAWGGDDPGYVEAELQVYTGALALLHRLAGSAPVASGEWLGRALSAAALAATAWLVWVWLRTLGLQPAAALIGTVAFATSRGTVFLVSVQPDAFGLAATTGALVLFTRWLHTPRRRDLALSSLLFAIAGGIKPTFLAAGLAALVTLLGHHPAGARLRALRSGQLWTAASITLLAVALLLAHGASLHADYGNTFGIISGGDSKFPTLDRLASPMQYVKLAQVGLAFGPGPLGALGLILVLSRLRHLTRPAIAAAIGLWAAYALVGIASMRYASEAWLGSHYHALGVLAGAVSLGVGVDGLLPLLATRPHLRRLSAAAVSIVLAAQLAVALQHRRTAAAHWADRELQAAAVLRRDLEKTAAALPDHGVLVVIRSGVAATTETGAPNNYEDPRIFYLAGVRGWVWPSDGTSVAASLPALRARGARYYVDPTDWPLRHPEDQRWLDEHSSYLRSGVFRL
jgi:hypothetical protein